MYSVCKTQKESKFVHIRINTIKSQIHIIYKLTQKLSSYLIENKPCILFKNSRLMLFTENTRCLLKNYKNWLSFEENLEFWDAEMYDKYINRVALSG
jgi:hypothetical protein